MSRKEIRTDLFTQAEYARKIGKERATVNQMIKRGELNTVTINGTVLIKI